MAQWIGQYTGKTHSSKVADAEARLQSFLSKHPDIEWEKNSGYCKQALKLATAVWKARLKLLSARISSLEEKNASGSESASLCRIKGRYDTLQALGPSGVLEEFKHQKSRK